METKASNIGMTYGLISGLALVLFGLTLYLAGVQWFLHPVAFSGFLIPIIIAITGGLKQKKNNGGYLEFSEALKVVFLIFIVGTFISTLFNYILFNFIDVPFREALSQASAEKAQVLLSKFGASQEQIDKAGEDALKRSNYSAPSMLLNMAFGLIFWFVASVIIAAIIKKSKPVFSSSTR